MIGTPQDEPPCGAETQRAYDDERPGDRKYQESDQEESTSDDSTAPG